MYLIQTVLCITALELVIPVEEGARKGQYKHKGSFAMKFLKIVLLFEPCAPGKVPSNRGLQGVSVQDFHSTLMIGKVSPGLR